MVNVIKSITKAYDTLATPYSKLSGGVNEWKQRANPYVKRNSNPLQKINAKFREKMLHDYARAHTPQAERQKIDAMFQQRKEDWQEYVLGNQAEGEMRTFADVARGYATYSKDAYTKLETSLKELNAPEEVKANILREVKYFDTQRAELLKVELANHEKNNKFRWAQRQKGKSDNDIDSLLGSAAADLDNIKIADKISQEVLLYNMRDNEEGSTEDWTGNKLIQGMDKRGVVGSLLGLVFFNPGTTQVRVNGTDINFDPRSDEAREYVLNHVRYSDKFSLNANGHKSATVDIELEENPRRDGWGKLKDKLSDPDLQHFKKTAIDWLSSTSNRDAQDPFNERTLAIARLIETQEIMQQMWRRAMLGDPIVDLKFKIKGQDSLQTHNPTPQDWQYVKERRGELCKFEDKQDTRPEEMKAKSISEQIKAEEEEELKARMRP